MSDGVVTAYFIFPPGFHFNLSEVEKYGKIERVDETNTASGIVLEFKDKELSKFFWDNWKRDYKFEV